MKKTLIYFIVRIVNLKAMRYYLSLPLISSVLLLTSFIAIDIY